MKKFKKIIFFTFLFLVFFAISLQVAQAVEFRPNVQIPGTDFATVVDFGETTGTYYIARYVIAIYDYGISIGAILATVMLMAAGVIWLTSGGSQDKIGQAKNMISGSIIGLVLLFGSYTILNMVNPELVNFNIRDIPDIGELERGDLGCCEENNLAFITDELSCNGAFYSHPLIWPNENDYNGNPPKTKCIEIFGCCQVISISGVTGMERKSCYTLETEDQSCQGHYGPGGSSTIFERSLCASSGSCIRDGGGDGAESGGGGAR